ncbi:MAG: glycine reductase, partial [Lachnospiraceae bacterium]|nr:glycine reductase [Lachnospiraceae bacterium]
MSTLNETIAKTFMALAEGLETGQFGNRPKVALTGMGSEHGESNSMQAAILAAKAGVDVYYIGTYENPLVKTIKVKDDEEGHKVMDELLNAKKIDAAVTMHYPFPIGVSTVGRVVTPANGKEMFIANTTGTSSTDRVEGMIINAISGIIVAKATGITNPTVGILNIEGAKAVEKALNELKAGGYEFTWGESKRADGGVCLRGNDVLQGTTDILVTDSLTGNVLMKVMSAFMSGG